MTTSAISGAPILTPRGWLHDHAIVIERGKIAALPPVDQLPAGALATKLDGGFLLPGFIDAQVNGGGGVLFNEHPDIDGIRTIAAAHRRFGTTALLPTLISDDLHVIAAAIAAVEQAIDAGVEGVIGIHIEGPFLNAAKRGIHDSSKFKRLDAAAVDLLSSLKNGVTLVTLAPELTDGDMIAKLVARGVVVAAGHTMAGYEVMQRAMRAGLSGVTHLFNAMTQMESRSPGVVGAALEGVLTCGIIVDGHHVHPAVLRVALASAGVERLMLVTDAMPTVGTDGKSFVLGGKRIEAADGACRASDGTLAGSDLDMARAVRNAMSMLGVDIMQASAMASATPASFLHQAHCRGVIGVGMHADLVHLDSAFEVRQTWIAGAPR